MIIPSQYADAEGLVYINLVEPIDKSLSPFLLLFTPLLLL